MSVNHVFVLTGVLQNLKKFNARNKHLKPFRLKNIYIFYGKNGEEKENIYTIYNIYINIYFLNKMLKQNLYYYVNVKGNSDLHVFSQTHARYKCADSSAHLR